MASLDSNTDDYIDHLFNVIKLMTPQIEVYLAQDQLQELVNALNTRHEKIVRFVSELKDSKPDYVTAKKYIDNLQSETKKIEALLIQSGDDVKRALHNYNSIKSYLDSSS